jgi:hypothetical protein
MLTWALKSLEGYGMVERTVGGTTPPQVEYALTDGRKPRLIPEEAPVISANGFCARTTLMLRQETRVFR